MIPNCIIWLGIVLFTVFNHREGFAENLQSAISNHKSKYVIIKPKISYV